MTLIILTIMGAALGSFLNVCIDRLPRRQSLLRPPSHCDGCGVRLGWKELVPLFSYLLQLGRCRHCQISIPLRSPLVEVIMAGGLAWSVQYLGLSIQTALLTAYLGVLTAIFFIGLEQSTRHFRAIYCLAAVFGAVSLVLVSDPLTLIGSGMLVLGASSGTYLVSHWRRADAKATAA